MDENRPHKTTKNTLLTIILVLLILISCVMIYNFYFMRYDVDEKNIPRCVGSDDLDLNAKKQFHNIMQKNKKNAGKNIQIKSYSDGSLNRELEEAMISSAKSMQNKEQPAIREDFIFTDKSDKSNKLDQVKTDYQVKTDHPEKGILKFCIYHMNGCGHCEDIMSIPQSNGLTKFEELKNRFKSNPSVKILDFKSGVDSEASKYRAFPVLMVIKEDFSAEYERERTVDGMENFIRKNM